MKIFWPMDIECIKKTRIYHQTKLENNQIQSTHFSLCSQMKKIFFILCLDFSSSHMDHYSYTAQVHPPCRQDGVSNVLWYKSVCCVYCDSEDIKCTPFCILLESLIIQWKNLEILVKWATQNRLTQPEAMAFPQLLSSKNVDEHREGKKQNILSTVKMSASMSLSTLPEWWNTDIYPEGSLALLNVLGTSQSLGFNTENNILTVFSTNPQQCRFSTS